MTYHRDDRGQTRGGKPYRVIADNLVGGVGPIAVAINTGEEERLVRYGADGVHPGGLYYQDLLPPVGKA